MEETRNEGMELRAKATPTASSAGPLGAVPLLLATPASNWKWTAARGVLLLILGALAIAFPFGAVFTFAALFAGFALANGILSIIAGVRGARDSRDRWWALVVSGVVGIAIGILFLFAPLLTTFSYAFVTLTLFAAWALITGGLETWTGVRLRREMKGEWLLILSGALTILLGLALIWFMVTDPVASFLSVGWLIGIYALASGVILLVLAWRMRRGTRADDGGAR